MVVHLFINMYRLDHLGRKILVVYRALVALLTSARRVKNGLVEPNREGTRRCPDRRHRRHLRDSLQQLTVSKVAQLCWHSVEIFFNFTICTTRRIFI